MIKGKDGGKEKERDIVLNIEWLLNKGEIGIWIKEEWMVNKWLV